MNEKAEEKSNKWKKEIRKKSASVEEICPDIADQEVKRDKNATNPKDETFKRTGIGPKSENKE